MATRSDFSYINQDGKLVSGSAAFNHHVFTETGGIQAYNDEVGQEYIQAFIAANSDIINERIVAKAKKKRFKVG